MNRASEFVKNRVLSANDETSVEMDVAQKKKKERKKEKKKKEREMTHYKNCNHQSPTNDKPHRHPSQTL